MKKTQIENKTKNLGIKKMYCFLFARAFNHHRHGLVQLGGVEAVRLFEQRQQKFFQVTR